MRAGQSTVSHHVSSSSVFFQRVDSFQASTCSSDKGHVLDFCIMMIICGFGSLNPLTHARLNRMSSAPPVPPFQLPRLTECLYSQPTAVTNPCMPGMHGTQDTRASKLPGRLGLSEHVSATECSLGTTDVAWGQIEDWFGSLLLPVDLTYVFLMCQHLYRNMSQLQTWTEKANDPPRPCAIPPDALPQHARPGFTSVCSIPRPCPSPFTPDEVRCSLSQC